MILAYMSDLMFRSKVKEAARAVGLDVHFVRECEQCVFEISTGRHSVVIIDLEKAEASLDRVGEALAHTKVVAVGYLSHVRVELAAKAESVGIQVMARSQFVQALPSLLQQEVAHEERS